MRKKNKLYTANRWNQPLFAQGIDREHQNIFDGLFTSTLNTSPTLNSLSGQQSGLYYQTPQLSKPSVYKPIDWSNNVQANNAVQDSQNLVDGFNKWSSDNNQFAQFTSSGDGDSGKAAAGKALMNTGLEVTGLIGKSDNFKRGLWDRADPVHYLAGGRESAVGNALGDAGVSVFKQGVQSGNGYMMLAGAGLKVVGGLTNAAFGTKWNQENIDRIENNTASMRANSSGLSGATTSDDFMNQASNLSTAGIQFSKKDIGSDGWFTNKVGKKFRKLQNSQEAAQAYANHAMLTGAGNVDKTMDENVMSNFAAFGGPLDGGAIDYGFMSDYLLSKNKAAEAKNRIPSNVFGSLAMTPMSTFALGGGIHIKKSHRGLFTQEAKEHGMSVQEFASHVLANKEKFSPEVVKRANFARNATKFALGGDMQTNGADFTDGLSVISAGGSHEENPYDGVQVGISQENGKPNLVEEGETIFDDYVYSKRIKADKQTKKKFHISKNANISYADLSKKLEKESQERPNDPLSQAALKKQMHQLAEEQERQKAERQAKEAQDAFDKLPPEQQQAIMQQIAMEEEQQAQEQQQQEQQPAEEPMVGQQEPQQMTDEQMMQQQQMNPQMGDNGEQINACGGKMNNRFGDGGDMAIKQKIYSALGNIYTDSDFDKWALDHKVDKITDWKNILKNQQFMNAVRAYNPALGDALTRGYDFGMYKFTPNNKLTFDFKYGGWGLEDYNAWNGSTDAAWLEAVKKGLVKEGMNSEEIGKALSQTDAYRRGSDWLKANEGNRLLYLQSVLNSEDAPQAARDYAGRFVDANGWKKDAKRDYQTIFEGPNGTGVRNKHPGTYWKTPNEIARSNSVTNYLVWDDGKVEQIYGDVPKDWISKGSYKWQTADSDNVVNYFARPSTTDADGKKKEDETELVPVHKPNWGRYAGLFGPVVGLGMQMAGIGKPDYSKLDASLDIANGNPSLAEYKPLGNYIGYRPMDIWYEQNRLDANSRATDRAIQNSSSPIGSKMAGLIANGYNSQIASGDLYRKALEYNDVQRQKVAEFNRGTDQFNADAFNKTSATNAEISTRNRQFRAQMAMDAARQRMAADAAWNQGIYGNVQGIFKGLGDWGKENEQHNMIADMAADSIFGSLSDKQHIGNGWVVKRVPKGTKKSKGGRINRKRGLTF